MPKVSEFHHGQKVWDTCHTDPTFGTVYVHDDGDRQVLWKRGSSGRFEESETWGWNDVSTYRAKNYTKASDRGWWFGPLSIMYIAVIYIVSRPLVLWERFWDRDD